MFEQKRPWLRDVFTRTESGRKTGGDAVPRPGYTNIIQMNGASSHGRRRRRRRRRSSFFSFAPYPTIEKRRSVKVGGLIGSASGATEKETKRKRRVEKYAMAKYVAIRGEKPARRRRVSRSRHRRWDTRTRFGDAKGREGKRQRGKRKRKGQRIPGAEESKVGSRARRTNGDRTRWSD